MQATFRAVPFATTMSKLSVLVFGDSLAENVSPPGYDVTIASHPGATTYHLQREFPNLQHYLTSRHHSVVVLLVGTNDLGQGRLPQEVASSLLDLSNEAEALGCAVVMCTLLDDAFNEVLETALSNRPRIVLCDFLDEEMDTSYLHDDGVHLNASGQVALSIHLADSIQDALLVDLQAPVPVPGSPKPVTSVS